MGAFSEYIEEKLLGHSLCGSTWSAPSTLWIGLATSITSDGNSVSEVDSNVGYARVAVGRGWTAPTSAPAWTVLNSAELTFNAATSPWGDVAHFLLTDDSSAGNVLYHGALDITRTVATSDVFSFPQEALSITLD